MFCRLRTPTHRISFSSLSSRHRARLARHHLHSVYRITWLFSLGLLFVDGRSKHRARCQSLERGLQVGRQPRSGRASMFLDYENVSRLRARRVYCDVFCTTSLANLSQVCPRRCKSGQYSKKYLIDGNSYTLQVCDHWLLVSPLRLGASLSP